MTTKMFAALAAVLVLIGAPASKAEVIANSSFESNSSWTISTSGGEYSAYYSASWSSDGTASFVFQRGTGAVTAGNYAQISQNVNLSGVTKFIFDCRDTGIDVVPLRFLIDGALVGSWSNNGWPNGEGSGWGHTAETFDIEIPLATAYTGVHALTIQMYNPISHYPADPKYYQIDNIRVVPEPATLSLLVIGAVGLFHVLRRRTSRK